MERLNEFIRCRGLWAVVFGSLLCLNTAYAQEVFMFVAGKKAPAAATGDRAHQYDFLIKPGQDAAIASLQIFDAAVGGVADIIVGRQRLKTTYQLFAYNDGQAGALLKTLVVTDEAKYINRWVEFDTLNPGGNDEGWILRVSADNGSDINSFKLCIKEASEDSAAEANWDLYSFDLPISLYGVSAQEEVQFKPAAIDMGAAPQLAVLGEERSVVYVCDNFGDRARLPMGKKTLSPNVHGFANEWGIAIAGSEARINNLVIKSRAQDPVLWQWKPIIVQTPRKPEITILQMPGIDCKTARLILGEKAKRELIGLEPKWVIGKSLIEGDSSIVEFQEPGTYEAYVFLPTMGTYFPRFWLQDFTVHISAPPLAAISAIKNILSPGEAVILSAPQVRKTAGSSLQYKWFVNDEFRGSQPALKFFSLLPGTYEVKLVVHDVLSNSVCSEAYAVKTIRVNSQPYAEIDAPHVVGRSAATKFSAVHASDNDGDELAYSWSGPGIAGAHDEETVTVKHEKAGDYRMTLTVSDQTGTDNSDYSTTFDYHVNADPVPVFALPALAAPGDQLILSAANSKDPDDQQLTFHWKVSDGSELSNPSAALSFDRPGDYTVTLIVDDGEGVENSVQSCEHAIHINAPPVPLITAADHSNSSRQIFSAEKTTDADQARLTYAWNFGDGSTAAGKTATHVFQQSGTYTITLTVNDGKKQTNSMQTVTHTLVINKNPVAEFTLPERWEPAVPLHVNGSESYDPDGTLTAFTWMVNGKETAEDSVADLVFPEPGDYAVALKVKDNSGFDDAVGLHTAKIHINYPPVIQWHTSPEVAEPNEAVTFDAKGTYDPDGTVKSITWNFSDGTSAAGTRIAKTFKNPGIVTVKMIVDDGEGFNNSIQTKEFTMLVNNPPIVVTKNIIHTNSRLVNLDASQSYDIDGQALKFDWMLSDGSHRHESSFNWQAPGGGVHFLTLTVDDGQGKKNSIARETIRLIVNRPPVAVVDSMIYSCNGQTVLFNGSRSFDPDNDPITTQWNFADGTTSTEMNPEHVYTKPGFYNVQLILNDGFAENPTVATIPVIIEGSPQALQNFSDTTVCVNAPIEFDATRSNDPNGPIGSFTWDFGDGITAFGNKVSHAYSKAGSYYAALTVVGNGSGRCSRVSQASSSIHVVEGPVANFSLPEAVSMDETITLDAAQSKANGTMLTTTWIVQAKDTVFSLEGSPVQIVLNRPGLYDVRLAIAIETKTNCNKAALTRTVRVNAPPVLKWNVPAAIAQGNLLVMDASASFDPDGIITDYLWTMDGKPFATTPMASIILTSPGSHNVALRIIDNSGTSSRSVSQETAVYVNSKPNPTFVLPDQAYEGETIQLIPSPSIDADGDSLSFVWKIDNNKYESTDLAFKQSGKHIVTLIANDGHGLSNSIDSVSKEISVIAKPDLKALAIPKDWLVSSEVDIASITPLRGIGFVVDSTIVAHLPMRNEGSQTVTFGWSPKGVILAYEQFAVQVWPLLKFTVKPEPQTLAWNPSNPAAILTAPEVNRPEGRNVRFEWKKGATIIGYGKVAAVQLVKGNNIFTVTALDQDMIGVKPAVVEIVVICQ